MTKKFINKQKTSQTLQNPVNNQFYQNAYMLSLLTGVPNDSHSENNEGEVAMSTDYGSDYVSGGNLLKFGPTSANLSG